MVTGTSWGEQVTEGILPQDIHSFIHLAVCLTTGPKPLPKRALHIVRSRASSFKWEYPLLSLRSSSSFLRLLPRLPVTSIPPSIFPSITLVEGSFYAKFWPFQLAFRLLISFRISLCSSNLSKSTSFLTRWVELISSILLQHHIYVTQNTEWPIKMYTHFDMKNITL
jgi:hypothetical protein